MLLHNHLDMIGRNEPIQRKAKFWQSYVRALKGPSHLPTNERLKLFALSKNHSIGTDDIRAPDAMHYSRYPTRSGIFRPLLSDFPSWPNVKSIYDDPIHAVDRIAVPGYRYLPISRETYGLSPRNIYPHHYTSLDRYPRHGIPIYSKGGYTRRPLSELLEPSNWIPLSRFTRDPWWWHYPSLRPFTAPYIPSFSSPFYLRDSYLSPVKRTYLWGHHPIRPFTTTPRLDWY